MQVRNLDEKSLAKWEAFVDACPAATFFHKAGWKTIIEETLGHATYFLYAEDGGKVCGVLPLGHIRSAFFGNALISAPFSVYGGIAADSGQAFTALQDSARELAETLGVDFLELRYREPVRKDLRPSDLYVTFRREISPDPEENLKAIPRKQRAMVRKGIKAGLLAELDEGVDRFFDNYSESLRNLGTPVLPYKWFRAIKEVFGDACEVSTITRDGQPICSVMSYYFRDEVLPYYGGGGGEARSLKGNDFMYWDLMRRASENGVRWFDYGRSKVGTGSFSFKKNWGFEPQPLYYDYHLVKAREVPRINPLNPKYRLFIKVWRRLPLSLSRGLGPLIAQNIG